MEYAVFVTFSYSSKFPDTPAVFNSRILPASGLTIEYLREIARTGKGNEAHRPLMEGLVQLLRSLSLRSGDIVNIHAYQEHFIDGIEGLMYAWENNGWQKFSESQPPAYVECWKYLYDLAMSGVRLIGKKEDKVKDHEIIEALLRVANARKDEIVQQRKGA